MTRIAHLSDPHFGTEEPALLPALAACLADLRPDAVVLSGDVTQRALPAQYAAAGRFLATCPGPRLVIPGNHDAPLWNLPLRLMDPWRDWRRVLALPLQDEIVTQDAVIAGINTADPRAWKDGRLRQAQLDDLAALFARHAGRRRIVAMHHPLAPPRSEPASLRGAGRAREALVAMGVEIVLSGHLHFTHVAPVPAAPGLLSVQAGTCLSTRRRGDGNAFSLIDLAPQGGAVITHYRAEGTGRFRPDAVALWSNGPQGWQAQPPATGAGGHG